MFGILIITIGLFFLLKNLGFITGSTWNILWPLLLIVIGLKLTLTKRNHCWHKVGERMRETFNGPDEQGRGK